MNRVEVTCYSGYKADETPVRFSLRERTLQILAIEDRWYDPSASYFRVRAGDGDIYILRHDEERDVWDLTGYRRHSGRTGGEFQ